MDKLKPWFTGPLELINHAEGHLKQGSDFDKRIALVSYDNAIEVSITTFLQLHPSQRQGKTYERKKTEGWLTNYYTKLEFLDHFAKTSGISLKVSIDEIIFYHKLRNELYHSGNGLVPESRKVYDARAAALSVFDCLFGVRAEDLLAKTETAKVNVTVPASALRVKITAQSAFIEKFIEFEKGLNLILHSMEVMDDHRVRGSMRLAWRLFAKHSDELPVEFSPIVEKATDIRNAIVHGQPSEMDGAGLLKLTKELKKVTDFIKKYPTSIPLELQFGLRAGSVYYLQSRELISSEPHFFVVVNRNPIPTRQVLLTVVTRAIDKVSLRNRERPNTVLEISPEDYDEFKVLSAVDCNVVLEKPLSELVGLVKRKEVRYHKDLSPEIFAKIKAAVIISPLVADELKLLL